MTSDPVAFARNVRRLMSANAPDRPMTLKSRGVMAETSSVGSHGS
jgi:hypothetical protein